ncbi:MAG TPA: hypothetical protein VN726_19270 [Hanamia sp.]|nr:hypothetical protein [Hanamia sp.]
MKKSILFRVLAITFLGLASLVMKSETCCSRQLNCIKEAKIESQILRINERPSIPEFPSDEGFLIKI